MDKDIARIETRFTRAYSVNHPIACAGLAFSGSNAALPIAVSEGGGIGAFGVGILPAEYLERVVADIRRGTGKPFNINFITLFVAESHIEACVQLRPDIVSFHWGHPPRDWVRKLHSVGIKVWEQIGSADAAKLALDDGVDLLVAQGAEAGGHNFGTLPTFVGLPAIVDVADGAMVLAAGGIADGRGLAAALALGADGVWVGTRFAATREANVPPPYYDAMVTARGEDTVLSSIFGRENPRFNPMRLLRNRLVAEYEGREEDAPVDLESQPVVGNIQVYDLTITAKKFSTLVPTSRTEGDFESMPLLMGQGVGMVTDIPGAQEVLERMINQALKTMRKMHLGIVNE
tara:strand:- start:117885 stop:118922 length:1038 start_codon:yes stop_codon:yes gene_type:complete